MMIFWGGNGWMVPAVTFGAALLCELTSEGLTGDDRYYQNHGLPIALALCISGCVNAASFWANYKTRFIKQESTKKKTRKATVSPGWIDHSFMFINQGVWVVMLFFGAFYELLARGL